MGEKPTVLDLKIENLSELFKVNTFGPLILFQQTHHLLLKRETRHFSVISSQLGSVGLFDNLKAWPTTPYNISKVAVNYLFRKAAIEHQKEDFTILNISPGREISKNFPRKFQEFSKKFVSDIVQL